VPTGRCRRPDRRFRPDHGVTQLVAAGWPGRWPATGARCARPPPGCGRGRRRRAGPGRGGAERAAAQPGPPHRADGAGARPRCSSRYHGAATSRPSPAAAAEPRPAARFVPASLEIAGSRQTPQCRWCGAVAAGWSCPRCGFTEVRAIVTGAARTAEELGRAFPPPRFASLAGSTSSPRCRRPGRGGGHAGRRAGPPPAGMRPPCCWMAGRCWGGRACGRGRRRCASGSTRPRSCVPPGT